MTTKTKTRTVEAKAKEPEKTPVKAEVKAPAPVQTVQKPEKANPGTPFKVDGAKAFIAEGAPHQRRNAARELAGVLTAYADAIVT